MQSVSWAQVLNITFLSTLFAAAAAAVVFSSAIAPLKELRNHNGKLLLCPSTAIFQTKCRL